MVSFWRLIPTQTITQDKQLILLGSNHLPNVSTALWTRHTINEFVIQIERNDLRTKEIAREEIHQCGTKYLANNGEIIYYEPTCAIQRFCIASIVDRNFEYHVWFQVFVVFSVSRSFVGCHSFSLQWLHCQVNERSFDVKNWKKFKIQNTELLRKCVTCPEICSDDLRYKPETDCSRNLHLFNATFNWSSKLAKKIIELYCMFLRAFVLLTHLIVFLSNIIYNNLPMQLLQVHSMDL